MKRAALYLRHSVADLNPETQRTELRQFAVARGYEVVVEYVDHGVNGAMSGVLALKCQPIGPGF